MEKARLIIERKCGNKTQIERARKPMKSQREMPLDHTL